MVMRLDPVRLYDHLERGLRPAIRSRSHSLMTLSPRQRSLHTYTYKTSFDAHLDHVCESLRASARLTLQIVR